MKSSTVQPLGWIMVICLCMSSVQAFSLPEDRSKPGYASAKRAVIIAVDGLGGVYLDAATNIPTLQSMYRNGSYTTKARNSMPTVSMPNFKTMLSGASPEFTGVYDNAWFPHVNEGGVIDILSECVHQGILSSDCAGCLTCATIVPAVQTLVQTGATTSQLLVYLQTACALFPASGDIDYRQTCYQWVALAREGQYSAQIQQMIQFLKNASSSDATNVCSYPFLPLCHDSLAPVAGGNQFPSLLKSIKDARPNLITAFYTDWGGISVLLEENTVDIFKFDSNTDTMVNSFAQMLQTQKPDVAYIHIDSVDHAGHTYGWGSTQYYNAITTADGYVKKILDALSFVQVLDQTLVIVVADHGGSSGHGTTVQMEVLIPFITIGPSVRTNHEISQYARNMDTSPTVLFALGIDRPDTWRGKPVVEIYDPVQPDPVPDMNAHNVIVLGIASLNTNILDSSHTPHLLSLRSSPHSAYTLTARTVFPVSSSLAAWASLLMGAEPEEHGVISDSWLPPPHTALVNPSTGAGKLFPSVFQVAALEDYTIKTSACYRNSSISYLFSPDSMNLVNQSSTDQGVVDECMSFLEKYSDQKNLMFMEIEETEAAAVRYGFFTPQYNDSVFNADKLVGQIMQKLHDLHIEDRTTIIVTSNRGRLYAQGQECMLAECMNVPFIIRGPNVVGVANNQISELVSIVDTAPTAMFSLGLPSQDVWTGKSVAVTDTQQQNIMGSSKQGVDTSKIFYGFLGGSIGIFVIAVSVFLVILYKKGLLKKPVLPYQKVSNLELDEPIN